MDKLFNDSRFTTINTNLASCLGALRIPLKNVQDSKDGKVYNDYIRRIEDAETGRVTVYWCFEENGAEHEARQIESHWAHKERFEAEFPKHPLIPMRKALEKLGWATKVWWGQITLKNKGRTPQFYTKDLMKAACFMAIGCEPLTYDIGTHEFGFDKIPSELIEDYRNYRGSKHDIATMRLVLECRALLMAELKRPDLMTQVHYKIGDPLNGGKEMLIVKGGVTEEQLNLLLEKFYE